MSIEESQFAMKEVAEMEMLQAKVDALQEEILQNPALDTDVQMGLELLHTLYALVEKQLVIFTRLRLSDDDHDKEIMANLIDQAYEEGVPFGTDVYKHLIEVRGSVKKAIMELQEDKEYPIDDSCEL